MGILNTSFNVFTTYFPRTFTTLLLVWSYWVLVFKVILFLPDFKGFYGLFNFIILSYLWVINLFTYYSVLMVGPGSPTDFSSLEVPEYSEDDDGNLTMNEETRRNMKPPENFILHSVMVKNDGGFRFCSKCKCWKPDRSHHCSVCGKCILKMDHHCPWFSECIGFKNYRYFIQFLIYCEVYLIYVTWMSGWILLEFFLYDKYPIKDFSFHILFVFCLGMVFTFCIFIFGGFTVYQLLKNKTTIESYELQRYKRHGQHIMKNVFDLGWRDNWRIVMGQKWWQWVFPIKYVYDIGPQCEDRELYADGLCFPLKDEVASGFRLVDRLVRVSGDLERGRS